MESADVVVVVSGCDLRSCFAGRQIVDRIRAVGTEPGLVVRGPSPGGIGPDEVAEALGLPLFAAMRPEHGLDRDLEAGVAPADRRGPLRRTARQVLDLLPGPEAAGPSAIPAAGRPSWN